MCGQWGIPFISLDGVDAESIPQLVESMEPKPRVILSTISKISEPTIQKQIRRMPIKTICLDEVQVLQEMVTIQIFALTGIAMTLSKGIYNLFHR